MLYLTDTTLNGGLGWSTKDALDLYGIYTGLVYITPMIGGYLADNFLGQRRSIFDWWCINGYRSIHPGTTCRHARPECHAQFFYLGLALLIAGNGLFKPNISTMVGDLYEEGDNRRDGAFTIFYMGINLGALIAGVVSGSVTNEFGWKAGFMVAGIGMVISLIMQMTLAKSWLGDIGVVPAATRDLEKKKTQRKSNH
ncbi:oligopeptide:H+ symporter [Vibrio sinaloensis]|nr:oligopeptide:H+ symporter [Vibrio sinaloensis]